MPSAISLRSNRERRATTHLILGNNFTSFSSESGASASSPKLSKIGPPSTLPSVYWSSRKKRLLPTQSANLKKPYLISAFQALPRQCKRVGDERKIGDRWYQCQIT